MEIVITVRKTVPDTDEAKEFFEDMVEKLTQYPGLKITGHVTNHFEPVESPPHD